MWRIETYDFATKQWLAYGKPSSDYNAVYRGCVKLCEAGYKARVRRVS